MVTPSVLVDTSLLIDFFRKYDKEKSPLFALKESNTLCVSVITQYE
jgi:predicted nucleic acid-binding protein